MHYAISKQEPRISSVENPVAWSELVAAGDDFNVMIPTLSVNYGGQINIYGVEIEVEYDLPINKVVYGTTVLVDLTEDTVTSDDLSEGITAHDASGALITGTNPRGVMVIRDSSDSHGGTVRTITSGEAQVGGMTEADLKSFIQRSSSFTDIDWPEGLTTIGRYSFAGLGGFNPSSLPDSVTSIGEYAFYSTNLSSLTKLPSGLKSIGSYAFFGTKSALTSLPNSITTISDYAFRNCTELILTSLPEDLSGTIGSFAFGADYKITLSVIPSGVTAIGSYAFSNCSGISSISCDGLITSIASGAFNGSSAYPMSLTSASFPNMTQASNISTVFGVTTAANACQQLEFCDIGSTVGIASNAFANCYALQTLVLRKTASVCTLANVSAFLNTPMRGYNSLTGTVYVPQALIESYKTATNWSTLYNDGTVTFAAIEGSEYERE